MKKIDKKLYCFQYDVTNNAVFKQGYTPRETENNYEVIFDEETDDHAYIDKEKVAEEYVDGDIINGRKILYVYTFNENVNHAMELFEKEFAETIAEEERKLRNIKQVHSILLEKQAEILAKYPNGVKENETYGERCN